MRTAIHYSSGPTVRPAVCRASAESVAFCVCHQRAVRRGKATAAAMALIPSVGY